MGLTTTDTHKADFATGDDNIHQAMLAAVQLLTEQAQNYVTTVAPALTIGSSSKKDIRINVAVDYVRDGQRRTQKAAAEVNVPSGASMADDSTAREVCVLVYIDTSDAFTALAGTPVSSGATASIPSLPAGCVQLGYVRIAAASGTAFTADTTDLDAAGLTVTYVNQLVPAMIKPTRQTW